MRKDNVLKKFYEELDSCKKPERAKKLQSFFKTAKGEYGYGDIFLGIYVPDIRKTARKYFNSLSYDDIATIISSKFHEYRLCGAIMLVYRFEKAAGDEKRIIYDFYMNNLPFINNWDLVDLSAPKIVGAYLLDKNRDILYKLAKSNKLFFRRIAVLSTFYFIKHKEFEDSKRVAKMLLEDREDLIHKAVGWMLREIGKKDEKELVCFLDEHYQKMPRTMLRYAIERFSKERRQKYLNGLI